MYGSSTPVLRGSRKGRVRLVQEFGERWLNQCSYPHVVVLSFCHLSCKFDTFPVFRLPPCVVFGADGNGAWDDDDDDDDMPIIGFVDYIYYLVGEKRVRKGMAFPGTAKKIAYSTRHCFRLYTEYQ